ncbi:AAA family ATPase [Methanoregula sp.]|uniref:ParA family protein n=1 Tax=Methanoregula sp. TaxID=2052170 RepID=UPI00344FF950
MTFSHHKGGTGKTTSCLNIAGFLVQAGKKVLVVDCDPQANATVGLRYISQATGKNMYDVFMSGFEDFPETFPVTPISEIIRNTPSGIDLAPSHLDLVGADPYLYRMEGRAGILKEALATVRDQYDYILIDTPPSLGQLVINGLYAADHLIVTLDSGSFALDGVATLSTIFSDMKEDLGREIKPDMAIVSRWAEGATPAGHPEEPGEKKDLMSLFRALFYKKPEPTQDEIRSAEEQKAEHERLITMMSEVQRLFPVVYTIPFSPLIYEAQKRGLPISHFAPDSSAGVAYKTIAEEVLRWH